MNDTLQTQLKHAFAALIGVYALLLGALIILGVYNDFSHHTELANSIAQASRNGLVTRDLRQAVNSISLSAGDSFLSISFIDDQEMEVFALPNRTQSERAWNNRFNARREIRVTTDGLDQSGETLGRLRFSWSIWPPILVALGIWTAFLLLVFPLSRRIRDFTEARHREQMNVHEATVLSDMAKQVAHDIRSPLSALQIASRKLPDSAEANRQLIESATKRIEAIAEDLLVNHRADSLQDVDLCALVKRVCDEKRVILENRTGLAIQLNVNLPTGPCVCRLRAADFARVLSNLLNNAMESIENEGRINVTLIQRAGNLSLAIVDTGKGIPGDILSRLGRQRLSTGKEQGNGLGLYHAFQTVESTGGQIKIESVVGRGTRVEIYLIAKSV